MQNHRIHKNWVCDGAQDDKVSVTVRTISSQEEKVMEALQFHLANRCNVCGECLVHCTNLSQQQLAEPWCDPREIQRSGKFGYLGDFPDLFVGDAHYRPRLGVVTWKEASSVV